MKNELMKQETKMNVDMSDILIGKVLVGQAMSEAVKGKIVEEGDIYESLDNKILAKKNKDLDIVVCSVKKMLYLFCGKEFVKVEEYHPNYKYEEIIDKNPHQRFLVYSFLVLLHSDLKGNPEEAFPLTLNLLKTNTKTAKKMVTHMAKLQAMGKNYNSAIYTLKSISMSMGKHSWFALDVTPKAELISKEMLDSVNKWVNVKPEAEETITEDVPF